MGGPWRYKLTVSVKLPKRTIHKYKNLSVDCVANRQYPSSLQHLQQNRSGLTLELQLIVSVKFKQSRVQR